MSSIPASSRPALAPAPASKRGGVPDATGEASASLTPELVVALCGPIGSPLHEASDQIANTLVDFGYVTEKIRLSAFIRANAGKVSEVIDLSSRFREIKSLISVGDSLREKYGNDILAKLAIAKIGADRQKKYGEAGDKAAELAKPDGKQIRAQRICHIVDSVKNSFELDLLRLIYGEALLAIGVFSPLEVRQENLKRPGLLHEDDIKNLIDMDSGEEFDFGQSVRDTFPKCDYFLRVDHAIVAPSEEKAIAQIVEKMRRFFNLVFHTAVISPTPDETAMYSAASAGRNSACISRQVGASVTSESGELLAVGWNDVPQSGGGLYGKPRLGRWPVGLQTDDRCYAKSGSKCFNDLEKKLIAEKIVSALGDFLPAENRAAAVQKIIGDSRVKDLIEFSRAVHAEMHAILGASRVAGDRVVGGKLYVTTYPCHSCARHIVAAGISEVHYIEPYRKSLATKLHSDSLTEVMGSGDKMRLLQFDGVAPRRFIDLFEATNRKEQGALRLKSRDHASPSTHVSLKAIPRLEEVVVAEIYGKELVLPGLINAESASG